MVIYASHANGLQTELDNFPESDITKSNLKIDKNLSISFKRGSWYSQGHSHTILFASWGAPSLGHCCEQELFAEMTDGSDKRPVLIDGQVAWRVFYALTDKPDLTVVHCWKMNAANTELIKSKTCPKPKHPGFKKGR
jgi:hypothetical protein